MKVLVVDDSEDVRLLFASALRRRGHEARACADAESAWDACLTEHYPLVILDWFLPGMDGLSLCRRLRALPDGDRHVILVATASDRPADVAAALDAGATDYLAKPIGLPLLDVRLAIAERQAAEIARRKDAELARQCAEAALRAEYARQYKMDGALLVARTVAHELNNALSPITGYAELLEGRMTAAGDSQAACWTREVLRAAEQLTGHVAQLQHIVRIEETPSVLGPDRPLLDLARSTAA